RGRSRSRCIRSASSKRLALRLPSRTRPARRAEGTMNEQIIAFLVYPDLTPLDLIGPLQVIKCLEGRGGIHVVTVGERQAPMATDLGLQITPERAFDEIPHPHAIVVPGGVVGPFTAMCNERLIAWLRSAAEGATIVASVCTGSLVLGAAGLLDG